MDSTIRKYTGDDLGISAEDLLQALSDFFLQSGFKTQYMQFSEWNQHTLEDLKQAIQQALEHGELFDRRAAAADAASSWRTCRRSRWTSCSRTLVQKLVDEGHITHRPGPAEQTRAGRRRATRIAR